MATQFGVTNAKASQANNFRSKPTSVSSNIVTAPSKAVVKEPPPLFPPNPLLDELPKPKPDVYLLRQSVSIKQLFRSSPFFLQPQQKTKDIERYADKYFNKEPSLELNNVIMTSSGMFPAELISDKDKKILRANLLKRKVPDTVVQPLAVDVLEQTAKKGKKKSDTKKTPKTAKRKKGNDTEANLSPKSKGPTKGKSKKGKEIDTAKVVPDKEVPIRLTKLTNTLFSNRDEMEFQTLTKWEEQEAKETEEIDEDQETSKKKKKTQNDIEDDDNEQQVDVEEDENLLDEDDYNNLFDNDDIEDDYNDAGGSDGEPYMD